MGLMITTVLIAGFIFAMLIIAVNIGAKYEEMEAFTEVDRRFQLMWDGSKTNEWYTWMKLRNRLEIEHADSILKEACEKHIAIARQRHQSYRTLTLSDGREVVVSKLN